MSDIRVVINGVTWIILSGGYPERNTFVVAQPLAKHAGWETLEERSPSGKQLFRCETCWRVSATPDKECPVGKTVNLTNYLVLEPLNA